MGSRIPTIRYSGRRDGVAADGDASPSRRPELEEFEAKVRHLEIKVAQLEARLDRELQLLEVRTEARLQQSRIFAVKVAFWTSTFFIVLLGLALWPLAR